MSTFTLFWLDGKVEIVTGDSPEDAFTRAGYGAGALRALDFWARGDERDAWTWDTEKKDWRKTDA